MSGRRRIRRQFEPAVEDFDAIPGTTLGAVDFRQVPVRPRKIRPARQRAQIILFGLAQITELLQGRARIEDRLHESRIAIEGIEKLFERGAFVAARHRNRPKVVDGTNVVRIDLQGFAIELLGLIGLFHRLSHVAQRDYVVGIAGGGFIRGLTNVPGRFGLAALGQGVTIVPQHGGTARAALNGGPVVLRRSMEVAGLHHEPREIHPGIDVLRA